MSNARDNHLAARWEHRIYGPLVRPLFLRRAAPVVEPVARLPSP